MIGSLFVYKMALWPNIPIRYIDKFYEIVNSFLWGKGKLKTPLEILMLGKEQGDLRLVNLDKKQKALKVKWVLTTITDIFFGEMATNQLIPELGLFLRWLRASDIRSVIKDWSFWTEVLEAWCEYNFHTPEPNET